MKTWYVWYRLNGCWFLFTDCVAKLGIDALYHNMPHLVKLSNNSGYYKVTSKCRLPWDKNK